MDWLVNAVTLLAKGGFVMIPLMVCSVSSIAILIERFCAVKKAQVDVSEVVRRADCDVYSGNHPAAIETLESVDSPVTRVVSAGLRNYHIDERAAERAMEEQGTRELAALNRRVGYLDTIITVAPLLGLLGTVTGMISAFHVIATKEGISTPTTITGGVAEALIATATGLAIAIVTLVGYNHLQERIKHLVAEIEIAGTAMMNVLGDAREEPGEITRVSA